jgi:pimeloyl-ACP methyl ester carboxylesterase
MSAAPRIESRFVKVDGREVFYLRAGDGSPAVLVHPSPADSSLLRPLIQRVAANHTCFAFDNPGYGRSDPLPPDRSSMADLADAIAATMRAMKFPSVPVFGTHTGAAIALELGVRHPDLVSGLVLDGVPIFTKEETDGRAAAGYFPPFQPDLLGGHFASTWTRFRDQSVFSPWCVRRPENLIGGDPSGPDSVHDWMMMFFRTAKHYVAPYTAAHRFGEVAAERLAALTVPAIFTAASTDGLSKHFNRFPALRPDQEIRRLGPDRQARTDLIVASIDRFDGGGAPPADLAAPDDNFAIERRYMDLPHGQIFVRSAGGIRNPPLLLLHDAPGSGALCESLIAKLALRFRVHAPDLPGCGESEGLASEAPSLADFGDIIGGLGETLAPSGVALYGIGIGASVAIAAARARPGVFTRIMVRGVLLPSEEEREAMRRQLAPVIAIDPWGGHWYRVWQMLRDSLIYWPWYDRSPAGLRRVPADFSAETLHAWTHEVMKQRACYQQVVNAAIDAPVADLLASLAIPMAIFADPAGQYRGYDDTVRHLRPDAAVIAFTAADFAHAEDVHRFAA